MSNDPYATSKSAVQGITSDIEICVTEQQDFDALIHTPQGDLWINVSWNDVYEQYEGAACRLPNSSGYGEYRPVTIGRIGKRKALKQSTRDYIAKVKADTAARVKAAIEAS